MRSSNCTHAMNYSAWNHLIFIRYKAYSHFKFTFGFYVVLCYSFVCIVTRVAEKVRVAQSTHTLSICNVLRKFYDLCILIFAHALKRPLNYALCCEYSWKCRFYSILPTNNCVIMLESLDILICGSKKRFGFSLLFANKIRFIVSHQPGAGWIMRHINLYNNPHTMEYKPMQTTGICKWKKRGLLGTNKVRRCYYCFFLIHCRFQNMLNRRNL